MIASMITPAPAGLTNTSRSMRATLAAAVVAPLNRANENLARDRRAIRVWDLPGLQAIRDRRSERRMQVALVEAWIAGRAHMRLR